MERLGADVGIGEPMSELNEIEMIGRVRELKDIGEKAGFKMGNRIWAVAGRDDAMTVRAVNLETFIDELCGCITVEGDLDPLRLKDT
jgi:hypothetical protein